MFPFFCHTFFALAAPISLLHHPLVMLLGMGLPLYIFLIAFNCPGVGGNLCHGSSRFTSLRASGAIVFTNPSAAANASSIVVLVPLYLLPLILPRSSNLSRIS